MKRYVALSSFAAIFCASLAFAQEQTVAVAAQPSFGEVFSKMMPMGVGVFVIWYLLVLKPQQVKQAAQDDLFKEMKKGDQVVTTGGVIGKVMSFDDKKIGLEVAPQVTVQFERAHVLRKAEV